MDRLSVRLGRRLVGAALGAAGVALTSAVMACPVEPIGEAKPVVDCVQRYSLEVVNGASGRVRVRLRAWAFINGDHDSGIIVLESGERETLEVSTGPTGCHELREPNVLVRSFGTVEYFDQGRSEPYRTYRYETYRCGRLPAPCTSDEDYIYQSADGTMERLFVESADRPFYLERDEDVPDLARIVITFVPSSEDGGDGATE